MIQKVFSSLLHSIIMLPSFLINADNYDASCDQLDHTLYASADYQCIASYSRHIFPVFILITWSYVYIAMHIALIANWRKILLFFVDQAIWTLVSLVFGRTRQNHQEPSNHRMQQNFPSISKQSLSIENLEINWSGAWFWQHLNAFIVGQTVDLSPQPIKAENASEFSFSWRESKFSDEIRVNRGLDGKLTQNAVAFFVDEVSDEIQWTEHWQHCFSGADSIMNEKWEMMIDFFKHF